MLTEHSCSLQVMDRAMRPTGSAVFLSACPWAQGGSTDDWDSSRCTWLLLKLTVLLIRHSPTGQRFYGPWNKVSLWGHFPFMWNYRASKHSEQHRILIHAPNSCGLLLEVEWKWPANVPVCQQVLVIILFPRAEEWIIKWSQRRTPKFMWLHHGWNMDHLCIQAVIVTSTYYISHASNFKVIHLRTNVVPSLIKWAGCE